MRTAILICVALLSTACAPQQKLLRHYQTYTVDSPVRPEALSLSVFPANPEASVETPFILDLAERAQAELIRSAASRMGEKSNVAELMSLITEPTEPEPAKCAWAKKTKLTKRLVINVLGDLPLPADRIEKLDLTLKLNDANAVRAAFLSWDRFTSKYLDFNIGTAKLTQSNKATIGLGRTSTSAALNATSGLEKVLNLGYEKANSLEESASYALHRLTVGGELSANSARLIQEGGPNYTLFGSSVATITFTLSPKQVLARVHSFKLFKEGKAIPPTEVSAESCPDIFPSSDKPIEVTVSGKAHLRLVTAGGETVTEGDDEVKFKTEILAAPPFTLASTEDLSVSRYALRSCKWNGNTSVCKDLFLTRDGTGVGQSERVVLKSMDSAAELRKWLMTQSKSNSVPAILNGKFALAENSPSKFEEVTGDQAKGLMIVPEATNDK